MADAVPTEAPKPQPPTVEHQRDTIPLQEVSDEVWSLRELILYRKKSPEFLAAREKAQRSSTEGKGDNMWFREGEFFTYDEGVRRIEFRHALPKKGPHEEGGVGPYRPEEILIATWASGDFDSREESKIALGRDLASEDGDNNIPTSDGPVVQFLSKDVYYQPAPGKKLPIRNTPLAIEKVKEHILKSLFKGTQ